MVFVPGAAAALEELRRGPFDMVVSDMRMPGMDGATLLAKVKEGWPSTTRVVLSGHSEREAVMRVLPIAQQFLGKPCDGGSLRSVIERNCKIQEILTNQELRAFIGKLDKIPSSPGIYLEMSSAIADPMFSAADLAKIVERDPAMATKVLQLVNSAYFGLARKVSSVTTAVPYLGFELLRNLALTIEIFSSLDTCTVQGFSPAAFQHESFLTARVAKLISPDSSLEPDSFTAGLLHDVGQVVLAMGKPREFQAALKASAGAGPALHVVEKELLGFTHAEVGAYLLGSWGLPLAIVESTAFHHSPLASSEQPLFGPLTAVHVADALVHGVLQGDREEAKRLQLPYLEMLGVADRLPAWRTLVAREHAAAQASA